MGNPEELRTAVFNLFDNAMKYSGGNKDIVVDVRTPDIDTISLSVRDQGIGIARPELKRIFNRFYRVQSPATGRSRAPASASSSCAPLRAATAATHSPKAAAKARAARSRCSFRGSIAYEPHPHRRGRNSSCRRLAFQSRAEGHSVQINGKGEEALDAVT